MCSIIVTKRITSSFKDTDSIGYDADIDADKTLVKMVESEDYEVFFEYKGLAAWVHKHNKSSVIITHPPLCDIFFSSAETEAVSSWRTIQPQGEKAKLAHLLQAIIQYIVTGANEITTNKNVFGNFLFAFAMRIYLIKNLHLHPYVATLFAKNMMWTFGNLFKTDYHDLSASERGVNVRQQRSVTGTTDRQRPKRMQNTLTLDHLDLPARIKEVVSMICMNLPENKYKRQGDIFRRLVRDYLHRGGITSMIKQQLVEKKKQQQDALAQKQDEEEKKNKKEILAEQEQAYATSPSSSSESSKL